MIVNLLEIIALFCNWGAGTEAELHQFLRKNSAVTQYC
jgi:hypothetical protein